MENSNDVSSVLISQDDVDWMLEYRTFDRGSKFDSYPKSIYSSINELMEYLNEEGFPNEIIFIKYNSCDCIELPLKESLDDNELKNLIIRDGKSYFI